MTTDERKLRRLQKLIETLEKKVDDAQAKGFPHMATLEVSTLRNAVRQLRTFARDKQWNRL
jgi:hypothetical protein